MKHNPRTMARAIKLMGEVSSPGQVQNVSEVEAALTRWISKVKMLESQFGEKVGDKMKIAIMTSMLPPVIQDFVYQNVTRDMLFDNLLEKIGVWVRNRVAMNEGSRPWTSGRLGGMTTTRARSTWMPLGLGRGAIGAMVGCTSHGTARAKARVSRTSARAAARGTATATVTRGLFGGAVRWDTRPTSARSRSRRWRR